MLTRILLSVAALASYAVAQSSSSTGLPNSTISSSSSPMMSSSIPNTTVSSTGINPNSTISSSSSMMNMSSSTGIMSSSGMMNMSSSTGMMNMSSSTGVMSSTGMMNMSSSTGMMNMSSSTGIMSSTGMMNMSSSTGMMNMSSSTGIMSSTGMMNMSSSTGIVPPPISSSTGMTNGTRFCGGAGFDLTSISGMDLTIWDGNIRWGVRPCGTVSPSLGLCAGQMCRNSTVISTYEPSLVNWYAIPNGVNLEVQNGDRNGCNGPRESDINFICSPTDVSPRLVRVVEDTTCHYRAIINTAAACNRNSSYQPGIGDAFTSPICGGGAYDLSSLNNADITGQFNTWNWTVRVCGFVSEPRCAARQPISICQHNAGDVWNLGNYATALPLYEINPNGLNMSMETGQLCGNGNRTTFITFDCDPSATTPVMTEASEYYQCEYWFRIRTNAVCGAPFQIRPPSSSSSSSSGMMSSSSSRSSSSSSSSGMMSSSSSTGMMSSSSSSSSSTGFTIPPPMDSSSSSSMEPPMQDSSSSMEPPFDQSSTFEFDFSSTGEDLENPGLNGAASVSSSVFVIVMSLMAVALAL